MKKITLSSLIVFALVVMSLGLMAFAPAAPPAQAVQGPEGDRFVLGENYTLAEGETLNGSLFVLGGNADLQVDSTVTGDVVLLGGNLTAGGYIGGDVTAIGGLLTLSETAVVDGDVNAMSANLLHNEGAEIHGDVNTDLRSPFFLGAPYNLPFSEGQGGMPFIPARGSFGPLEIAFNVAGSFLWWLGRSFIWAFLALMALLFWPRSIQRIADAAGGEPVASGGMGLLTAVIAPLVLVMVALTICGIPFALIGAFALSAAWALGIIALGLETGARLERMVHQDWAPPVQGAAGTFLLTLVINGVGAVVPCIGWMVPFTVGIIGLGAAILSRLGTRAYPPAPAMVAPASVTGATIYTPPATTDHTVDADQDSDLPPAS